MTEGTMRFVREDVEAAQAVLGRAVEGRATHVVTLTDEQVVVLDGLQNEQVVPTPWLSAQVGADRELVGKVALRAMLSQGHVVPAPGTGGAEIGLEAVPEITGTLVLRRTSQAVLGFERVTSLGPSWVFCYVHDGGGVLEEEVTDSGHHSFSVYPVDFLTDRLGTYLDPTSAAVMSGAPRTLSTEELEQQRPPELTEALVVTQVSAVRAPSDVMVTVSVYAGPRGVFVVRGGERTTETGPAALTLTELGPAAVKALVRDLAAEEQA
ncbi:hypothetical protein [Antribacter gilvus]|uniref:hypothetical protein n=1 Tax=Antribacter gilvus TaxID=2304675 RepID=UPI000F7B1C37|nr:hypothetical protein [Antribacter gilvus]